MKRQNKYLINAITLEPSMYKDRLAYRLLSIALASLILLTSFDYSVNLHYCQDSFAGISLSDNIKSCSSKASTCSAMKKTSSSEDDKNCCQNKKIQIDNIEKDFTTPFFMDYLDIDFDEDDSKNFRISSINNDQKEINTLSSYRPPPPDLDYQVRYQVFII